MAFALVSVCHISFIEEEKGSGYERMLGWDLRWTYLGEKERRDGDGKRTKHGNSSVHILLFVVIKSSEKEHPCIFCICIPFLRCY